MKVLDAAILVLKESDTPLHVNEITNRILLRKLWESSGETPAATVGAEIYLDIKKNGDISSFVRHAPATFGLRRTDSPGKTAADTKPEAAVPRTAGTPSKTFFSFTDSAQKVLEQFADDQPMHYRVVTDKALEMGWLSTEGKTPEASMYSQILRSIRRSRRRGEQPRFTQYGKGFVGLSKWMAGGLALEIEKHNKKVRKELHEKLLRMPWDAFEDMVARLLSEMGFDIDESASKIGDGGIDVRGTLLIGDVIRTRMAVQVKRWKKNIQAPIVQQVRGSLEVHEQGLIITTSDFSRGAREEATKPNATPVALMNGEQLVLLLVENGVGVERRSHDLIELEDEDASAPEHLG